MILDTDILIDFFNNFSQKKVSELSEDESETSVATTTTPTTVGGTSTGTGRQVKVWGSNRKMGPTYQGSKYVWSSGRRMGPTYQGVGYKWTSGRTMGPTGGSDFV